MLQFETYNLGAKPHRCIFWFHGLGAQASDMKMLAQNFQNYRHILVQAPPQAITLNNNMLMPAWYDIYGFGLQSREDAPGIKKSFTLILEIFQKQLDAGILAQDIYFAGFSQGGAMALYLSLLIPQKIAGVLSLSSYLPLSQELSAIQDKQLPIFLAAGEQDEVVLPQWTDMTHSWLKANNYNNTTYKKYNVGHAICPQEVADMNLWLQQV